MAGPKITYDVTGVPEDMGFYVGPEPSRGTYTAKIANVELGKSKKSEAYPNGKDMLTIRYEITKGEFKGWAGWDRITLEESTAFKMKQLIDATGLKPKGTVDALIKQISGKPVGVAVKNGSDLDGNPRAEINRPFALSKLGESAAADEESDEEPGEDAEPEGDGEAGDAGDESDLYTEDELKALTKPQLLEIVTEWREGGVDIGAFTSKTPASKIIAAILLGQQPAEAEDDAEPDGDEEPGFDRDARSEELADFNRAQLKAALKEAGSDFVVKKSTTDAQILEQVLDAEEAAADEEPDGEPPF